MAQVADARLLEREIEELRRENARLKRLLKLTDREAAPAQGSQAAWFDRDPGPVNAQSSPAAKVAFYAALFGARTDVVCNPLGECSVRQVGVGSCGRRGLAEGREAG